MAVRHDIIQKLLNELHATVNKFNKGLPGIQQTLFDEIELLAADLDKNGKNISASVKNLEKIAAIKKKLERVITTDPKYLGSIKEFVKQFDNVVKQQNSYFYELSKEYKPLNLTKAIQQQAKAATIQYLTSAGISSNIIEPLRDILNKNITTGASYTDLVQQLRSFMTNDKNGVGKLERYAKQITTDGLNQFAAQNMDAIASDLQLEWFRWVGPEIETTRDLCSALIDKEYMHLTELPNIIKGDFPEFKDLNGKISSSTKRPYGMVPGTNPENFHIYRGGYNCGHQLVPVDESVVPFAIRNKINHSLTPIDPLRKRVKQTLKDTMRDKHIKLDGYEEKVHVNRKGIDHASSYVKPDKSTKLKLQLLFNLNDILKVVKFDRRMADSRGRNEIKGIVVFKGNYEGKTVEVLVRETQNGPKFYDIKIL